MPLWPTIFILTFTAVCMMTLMSYIRAMTTYEHTLKICVRVENRRLHDDTDAVRTYVEALRLHDDTDAVLIYVES